MVFDPDLRNGYRWTMSIGVLVGSESNVILYSKNRYIYLGVSYANNIHQDGWIPSSFIVSVTIIFRNPNNHTLSDNEIMNILNK